MTAVANSTTFQSSFELTGYITIIEHISGKIDLKEFQSSFELTGYITEAFDCDEEEMRVSKLFRAYRLYNPYLTGSGNLSILFQSSFELTGYITLKFCKW